MVYPTLTPALNASRRVLEGRIGPVNVYVAGEGPPLLLIHSMNASASAYEIKPIFEAMQSDRQVWAPDLPGYGFSDRGDRHYDRAVFVDAIELILDAIHESTGVRAVDVLALSLSAEFVARLALRRPECFRSLTLVNPTGFNARAARNAAAAAAADHGGGAGAGDWGKAWGDTFEVPGLHAFLSYRLWTLGLFEALTSRRSIQFFLRGTFGSKAVDPGLIDYAWQASHQPGARFAPLAFVCGRLFSRDVVAMYKSLELPVWMPHGVRGDFRDFSGADWARAKPNWTVVSFATGAFPHFEDPPRFAVAYRRFLNGGTRETASRSTRALS
jgi:pimeloyl-ACP methyl ester carboxylesterase